MMWVMPSSRSSATVASWYVALPSARASVVAGEPDRAVGVPHGAVSERPLGRLGVDAAALALPHGPFVPGDAEPAEVVEDRLLAAGHVALRVGVVDAQDERAAVLVGEGAVGDGAERVAEMERPRRARREADADGTALRRRS